MSLDEGKLIERFLRPLAESDAAKGLRNDGAFIPFNPSCQYVITTDTIIEHVHFTTNTPAKHVAQKLLRVNVSDIVAMGAKATYYNLALTFGKGREDVWLEDFFAGIGGDQKVFDLTLLGGDTTAHEGPVTLTCTMIGLLEAGQSMLSRQGAQEQDGIYVTGTIGDAALGLQIALGKGDQWDITEEERASLLDRYYIPQPRCIHAKTIASFAHSGLDISDGLIKDIGHLTTEQKMGAIIQREKIPLSSAAKKIVEQDKGAWQLILGGGDDYEMVFTSSEYNHPEISVMGSMSDVPISRIGEVSKEESINVVDKQGDVVPVLSEGYIHQS